MTGTGNPYESIVPFLKAIPLAMFIIVVVVVAAVWLRRKAKEKRGELGGMTTVNATVIYKRRDVRRDLNSAPDDARYANTNFYYITFEEKAGSRLELLVPGKVYEAIRRGDRGVLSYQGLRFLDFMPQKQAHS